MLPEPGCPRQGIALALGKCSSQLSPQEVPVAVDFLLGSGLADEEPAVRDSMVKAGTLLVDAHGAQHAQVCLAPQPTLSLPPSALALAPPPCRWRSVKGLVVCSGTEGSSGNSQASGCAWLHGCT